MEFLLLLLFCSAYDIPSSLKLLAWLHNVDVVLQKDPTIITAGEHMGIFILFYFIFFSFCLFVSLFPPLPVKRNGSGAQDDCGAYTSSSKRQPQWHHLTSHIHLHLAFCNFLSCKQENRNSKILRIWTIVETSPTLPFLVQKPPERSLSALLSNTQYL